MRRPLLIVCVPLLLLAALALAVRWQLARSADALMIELSAVLAPQATLSWRETAVGFDGRLGARGLVLERVDGGPRITIDALDLDLGGRWATLAAFAPRSHHGLPPRLRVALHGVHLALVPPSATPSVVASATAPSPEPALGFDAFDVVPCGGLDSASALRALDPTPLVFDAELGWAFDRAARRVRLDAALRSAGLADLAAELELEARDEVATLEGFPRARPVARRGAFTLTERGWFERSATLCAARSALDREAWTAAHAAAVEHLLAALGIEPTPGLLAGYRAFREAPSSLRIGFDNAARRGADELLSRGPDELAASIGLRVEFNGSAVADAGFAFAAPQRLLAAAPLADAPRAAGEALAESSVHNLLAPLAGSAPAAVTPRPTPRRVTPQGSTTLTPNRATRAAGAAIAWDALPRARGLPVVVRMHDGRELGGVLREVTPWRLTLEQKIGRGSAVLPLAREDIARVSAAR